MGTCLHKDTRDDLTDTLHSKHNYYIYSSAVTYTIHTDDTTYLNYWFTGQIRGSCVHSVPAPVPTSDRKTWQKATVLNRTVWAGISDYTCDNDVFSNN